MTEERPLALFYGGTNGSGKSSLREMEDRDIPEIDPDAIAKNFNVNITKAINGRAGREAIRQFKSFIANKTPFSMETTLSGNSSIRRMKDAKAANFNVVLHFVGLETPDLNVDRVAIRVANGGHHIDEMLIRKRYDEGMINLQEAFGIADKVIIFDNSGEGHLPFFVIENNNISEQLNENMPKWIESVILNMNVLKTRK